MDQDQKQLVLTVKTESMEVIDGLASSLKTTPAGVISQALALLQMAQGRKVILKEKNNNSQIEVDKYEKQPARTRI